MDQNRIKTFLIVLWAAFMTSAAIFAYILVTLTGGLNQVGELDYNRMVRLDDPFSLNLYIVAALAFAAHRMAPRLVRGPNAMFTGFIIKLVILESIAMFGFVLGQATQDFQAGIPFFIVSLVGMAMASPLLKMDTSPRRPETPIT